jgi:hypothetical protein
MPVSDRGCRSGAFAREESTGAAADCPAVGAAHTGIFERFSAVFYLALSLAL